MYGNQPLRCLGYGCAAKTGLVKTDKQKNQLSAANEVA